MFAMIKPQLWKDLNSELRENEGYAFAGASKPRDGLSRDNAKFA